MSAPPPDYLAAECRACARALARLVAGEMAHDPEAPAGVPIEGSLAFHLRRVCNAEREGGARYHVVAGGTLRHAFPRHARYLEVLECVSVEPGRYALRRHGWLDEWRDVPGGAP